MCVLTDASEVILWHSVDGNPLLIGRLFISLSITHLHPLQAYRAPL